MVVLGDNEATVEAPGEGKEAELASSPASHFVPDARKTLYPIEHDLDYLGGQARRGLLYLDPVAAERLLASLSRLEARVHELIADSKETTGQWMWFGDNFVSYAMRKRLHIAAVGNATADGSAAAIPVLTAFSAELEQVRRIVTLAMKNMENADDDAKQALAATSEEQS